MITILLNSSIDMDKLNIHPIEDEMHGHDIDFKIASNIPSKFGFKLNNFNLVNNITKWSLKYILYSLYLI